VTSQYASLTVPLAWILAIALPAKIIFLESIAQYQSTVKTTFMVELLRWSVMPHKDPSGIMLPTILLAQVSTVSIAMTVVLPKPSVSLTTTY